MGSILLITQIVLAVFLTIVVLLQKSSSIGLGAYGGGSNDSVFGAKGAGGFLTKLTFTLGFIFVVNTIALTYTYNTSKEDSVVDMIDTNSAPLAPTTTKQSPATPTTPPAAPQEKQ